MTLDEYAAGSARVSINAAGNVRFTIADGTGRSVMIGSLDSVDDSLITWKCTVHDEVQSVGGKTYLASHSVNALGHLATQLSDGRGRSVQSIDALGKITTRTFDAAGNQLSIRDPNNVGQDCTYDELGRHLTCTDTAGAVTSMAYDKAGNKIASTDAKNKTTTYTFDSRGRQIKQTDRLGGITQFAYTALGQLDGLIDAEGQATVYTYDDAGNKLTEQYPDHVAGSNIGDVGYGIVTFTPDASGRTVLRTDQQGDTCDYDYDLAGRLEAKTYVGHASGPLSGQGHTDTFTYDGAGRMLTAVSGRYANTVTSTYDNAGRKSTEGLTIGGQTYTTTTNYDLAGQVSGYVYPDGTNVLRTYTDRGQLATIDYDGTTVDTRVYDDGGRLTSSTYNNGVSQTRTYNNDNTLTGITHAGAAIGDYSYTWDANKNKTSEAITGTMSGYGFDSTGYDDEDRLTAWDRADNQLDQSWNLSLVGDWNSFTENTSTQARTHGPTHELLTVAGQAVSHDAKGNQTLLPTSLDRTDPLAMKWDFENKLIAADTDDDATDDVSYTWDALLRRVGRDDGTTNSVYVQNGQQTVADYTLTSAATSPTANYTYAYYIDELVMRTGSGGNRYYQSSQQYSITALTNSSGNVVEQYAYDAYGDPTILDGAGMVLTSSAENNRYTYTGREYDEALGLFHYRARMYDSASGRFCSRDPIGYVSGPNLFAYVLNNPFKYVDPLGLFETKAECEEAVAGMTPEKVGIAWPKKCNASQRKRPKVVCSDCKNGESGHATVPGGNGHNTTQITICWKTAKKSGLRRILRHEYIHAIDVCRCDGTKILTDEDAFGFGESEQNHHEDHACLEIRAYSLDGGCDSRPTPADRRTCVRQGAINSIKISLGVSEGEAAAIVDATMDECYIPLDKVPEDSPMTVPPWPSTRPPN